MVQDKSRVATNTRVKQVIGLTFLWLGGGVAIGTILAFIFLQ